MKTLLKWTVLIFAGLILLGLIAPIVDPSAAKLRQNQNAASESSPTEAAERNSVFAHGYQVGFAMAKSGAVKPTSAQVDAYARQSANALGHKGGLGFKMQWKDGFWVGWSKGD